MTHEPCAEGNALFCLHQTSTGVRIVSIPQDLTLSDTPPVPHINLSAQGPLGSASHRTVAVTGAVQAPACSYKDRQHDGFPHNSWEKTFSGELRTKIDVFESDTSHFGEGNCNSPKTSHNPPIPQDIAPTSTC